MLYNKEEKMLPWILALLWAFNSNSQNVNTEFGFTIDSNGNTDSFIQLVFSRHIDDISVMDKCVICEYIFTSILNNDDLPLEEWEDLPSEIKNHLIKDHKLNQRVWDIILEISQKFKKVNKNNRSIVLSDLDRFDFIN